MRLALAGVFYRTGEYEDAEREARTAFEQLSVLPLDQPAAAATLAAALLAQGRVAEALTTARRAVHMFEERKAFGFKGTFASVIFAEALRASGAHEEAREAIAVARDRLLAMAARVENRELRRTFLENVAEHVRTLQLAKEWLGEAPKIP